MFTTWSASAGLGHPFWLPSAGVEVGLGGGRIPWPRQGRDAHGGPFWRWSRGMEGACWILALGDTTSKCPGAGKARQGWERTLMSSLCQNGVVAGLVLPLSEGGGGPCSQLYSMSAVGSGTPKSARVWVLSCGDVEGEGRSLIIGTGKALLEQRGFLLRVTLKSTLIKCAALPSGKDKEGRKRKEQALARGCVGRLRQCGLCHRCGTEAGGPRSLGALCLCSAVPSLSGELKGQECLGSSIPTAPAMSTCYVICCHQVVLRYVGFAASRGDVLRVSSAVAPFPSQKLAGGGGDQQGSFSSPSPPAADRGLIPLACARGTLEMSSMPHLEETQETVSPGLPLMHAGEVQPVLSEGTFFMGAWGHRASAPGTTRLGLGLFLCAVAPHVALPMSRPEPCWSVALCHACRDRPVALAVGPVLLAAGQALCRALGACPAQ